MKNDDFEASVGMTRKWDAREAGREVARNTIRKLKRPPSFFLLFSTIHYEKNGGFQEFLDGVWDVLPKGTPLVGGTVAGFMNPEGCYTRGASGLAVSYRNMDVSAGIGRNTKRNPKKAARNCAEMINDKLKDSSYEHKFIFDIVSSGLVPKIPFLGRTMIIRSKFAGKLAIKLLNLAGKIIQKGICRQDEVLREFIKKLPDYSLIHGGATDDISQLRNYQFYNRELCTNSICSLAINIDMPISVNTTYGLTETDRTFRVTSLDSSKRVIKSIDNKPALPTLFSTLHLDIKDLNEHIFDKIFFLPIGFKNKENVLVPTVVGIFLGDYFYIMFQIDTKEAKVLNLSGRGLLNSIDENLDKYKDEDIELAIISSCGSRLLALGNNVYHIYEKLKIRFKDKPFLIYYFAGEGSYSIENGLKYGNYTFNSAIFQNNYQP